VTELFAAVFSLGFVAQVLRIAVPYALSAMGGAVTERSGMIDLALEGKLLFGAFSAAAVGHATGSAVLGLAGGIAAGMGIAAIQAGFSLRLGANQVIVGFALNLIGAAGTRFLLQLIFGEGANSPPCPAYGSEVLGNPIVWLTAIAAVALPFALRRTRWGVRLRAAGDRPDALVAVGVSPTRARLAAALVGGALTGAGGAQLSLAVGGFVADMSSGRGYIALAMVIMAGWRPAWAVIACVGVAAAEALSITFQVTSVPIAHELVALLPYVATLAVLVIFRGDRRSPPRALGKL
jgi:general nucleoside transport system permease protein